jgi:hypothetical protein
VATLKRPETLDEIAHPEYIIWDNMQSRDLEAHKVALSQADGAWAKIEYSVEDIIEEDNKVAIRWKWKGKMVDKSETLHLNGIWFFEIEDGLIKTIWSSWDQSIFGE